MKNSRVLTRMLAAVVLLVWGMIAVQVYEGMHASDEQHGVANSTPDPAIQTLKPLVFSSDVRDPFVFRSPRSRQSANRKAKVTRKEPWMPPPLRLTGILSRPKKRSAVLENSDGAVYFLQAGDTVMGVRILTIEAQTVAYLYHRKRSSWELER